MKSPEAKAPPELSLVEFSSLVDLRVARLLREALGSDIAREAIEEAQSCYKELTDERDPFWMGSADLRVAREVLYDNLVQACGRNDGIFTRRKIDRVNVVLQHHITLLCKMFRRPR